MSIKQPTLASLIAVLAVALLLCSTTSISARHLGGKRFDCRLFCKMTGYHGTIGGCRCSFTLFTAKRSQPEWPSRLVPAVELDDVENGHPIAPATYSIHYRVKLPNATYTKRQASEEGERNMTPQSEEASFYNNDASIFKR